MSAPGSQHIYQDNLPNPERQPRHGYKQTDREPMPSFGGATTRRRESYTNNHCNGGPHTTAWKQHLDYVPSIHLCPQGRRDGVDYRKSPFPPMAKKRKRKADPLTRPRVL